MRIIIPAISLEKGGGSRFLYEVGSGLNDYGHDVHYVIIAGNRFHFPVRGRVSFIPRLDPELMPEGDFVLPNFYLTVPFALSGRAMPIRICLSYEPFFVTEPTVAAQTYTIPMPIATISGWLQRVLSEQTGRYSVVINPGLDHRVFRPGPEHRQSMTVLCIGRPAAQGYGFKGYGIFAQAIALVKARVPSVQVIVVSPEMGDHGLGIPATVVRDPSDQQLAALFRQVTVFVFPSYFEGFGLPPLEAMACGAPVVTTDCGGVSDFVRDGENCLMVKPGDALGLAEAIIRLLKDTGLRHRLSASAVETARPWTWVRTVDQMDHLLRRIKDGNYIV